jgi:hypothetical protein
MKCGIVALHYKLSSELKIGHDLTDVKSTSLDSGFFWTLMWWAEVQVYRRFGRTYYLHLQGRRIIQVIYNISRVMLAGSLFVLLFNPEDGCSTFLGKASQLLPDYTALHTTRWVIFSLGLTMIKCKGYIASNWSTFWNDKFERMYDLCGSTQ